MSINFVINSKSFWRSYVILLCRKIFSTEPWTIRIVSNFWIIKKCWVFLLMVVKLFKISTQSFVCIFSMLLTKVFLSFLIFVWFLFGAYKLVAKNAFFCFGALQKSEIKVRTYVRSCRNTKTIRSKFNYNIQTIRGLK